MKLSKAEHEKEIDATRFRRNIGFLATFSTQDLIYPIALESYHDTCRARGNHMVVR